MSTGLKILAAVGAVAYLVNQSFYTFDGDHRAHIPSYRIFVTPSEDLITQRFRSKDLQMINISLDVMSRPEFISEISINAVQFVNKQLH